MVLLTVFPQNSESRCVIEDTWSRVVSTEVVVSRNDLWLGRKTNKELHLPPPWHSSVDGRGGACNVIARCKAPSLPKIAPECVNNCGYLPSTSQGRGVTTGGARHVMAGIELILTSSLPLLFLCSHVSSLFPHVSQQSWRGACKPPALLVVLHPLESNHNPRCPQDIVLDEGATVLSPLQADSFYFL